jgi:hypothetical protein
MTPANNQLKVSMEPVAISSGAAGGALIGLITIFCLCFALYKRHNRPETEEQIDEFDLAIEHNEEEEFDDEDENVFDLENDVDQTNSNALSESESDNWVRRRPRREDGLRMDFDGQESWTALDNR